MRSLLILLILMILITSGFDLPVMFRGNHLRNIRCLKLPYLYGELHPFPNQLHHWHTVQYILNGFIIYIYTHTPSIYNKPFLLGLSKHHSKEAVRICGMTDARNRLKLVPSPAMENGCTLWSTNSLLWKIMENHHANPFLIGKSLTE